MSSDWRTSPLKRLEVRAIAGLAYPLLNALGHTWSWRVEGFEHFEQAIASGRPPVLAFFHGRILSATFYFRRRGIVVMTSENFDGEWIARIIERFGYVPARGSTSRGARKATLQMLRELRAGRVVGFTVDGPRGPARVVQPGAVWLAKTAGHPVIPFHAEAASHWTADSWDRTQVPKPFSRIALAIGEPLHVADDCDAGGLEGARRELETRLVLAEARARALLQA